MVTIRYAGEYFLTLDTSSLRKYSSLMHASPPGVFPVLSMDCKCKLAYWEEDYLNFLFYRGFLFLYWNHR